MTIEAKDEAEKYDKANKKLNEVMEETSKVIVGQEEIIENILISVICDGNILLESYPGLGKTKTVRTLSEVLGLEFSRIQNTPDLMPSDITGTHIVNEKSDGEKEFVFQEGPIFANMILADEINRATPKCVTAGTKIVTADGELREAEEIFMNEAGELVRTDGTEEWWKPDSELEVPSFDPETGRIENREVSYIYRQKTEKPTYRLRLRSGREIEVSGVHPFFTVRDGDIDTKKAKNIEEEDCVLLPGQIDINSSEEISYDQEAIQESEELKLEIGRRKHLFRKFEDGMKPSDTDSDRQLISTFQQKTPDYIQREIKNSTFVAESEQFGQIFPLEMPEKISRELAHFTALTVAEGYTSEERGIQIDMKSEELVEYSAELIEQLFDYSVKVYDSDGDKRRVVASSSTFSKLLDAMGFKIEANSGGKEIPEFIMKAPEEYVADLLEMFFEAEATVKREHVSFTSKSEKMINQLSYLLLRFGIVSKLQEVQRRVSGEEQNYWELRIYGENIQKFREEIGFHGEEKSEQLEELADKSQNGKFMDLVPDMHSEIREARKKSELTHEEFHELTGLYSHNLENPKNRMRHSKRKLKTICESLEEEELDTGNLKKIAEGDFTTDFVESIEKKEGEKTLYDLTVEDNHSFIAGKGGIIVHNTQAALLEAMQERQVTAGNESYDLDKPFFLMATQNPIDQEGSLHPDETLYMNGRLWKACEALEHAKKEGRLVEEQEDRKIYDAGDTTRSLNSEGEIEEAECMVYEKEYDGKTYSLETKTGRQIRVSGNHPFLVNRSGEIEWVKAFELEEDDFLVAPDRLEIEESESGSHGEILESMRNDYRVVRRKRVRQLNQKLESGESLNSKEIDDLRIASGLTKKELAAEAGVSYESVLNYLEGAENGIEEDLREAIQERKIEEGDYVEDFRVHRIGEISEYEAGFLVGFAMAEGEIGENSISVWQKNLEDKIDEWIKVAENAGLKVSTRKKDSCREAKISSKPFLDYLEKRFSIDSPAEIMQNPEAFREAFLEIFMLTESHFDKERRRITFTQKDREMVNLISHLLLEKGIRPWIYEEEDLYRLKVQGEDIRAYLSNFEWRGEEPCTEEFDSAHRTVPLDAGKAERLVELLGLKHQGDMASRDWYNSYSSLQSRGRMNENHFREFLDSIESVLEERKQGMYLDFQRKARDCGLSITEVKNRTGASKYAVSNVYSYGESIPQVADFIQVEYRARIRQAEQILEHLKEFRENEVFYDRIDSIEEEDYQGKIIGLSVPETHNYIAGLGACGINHNTYPLPEAQKDRFMMKLELDYPPKENERKIVDRFTSELNYSPKLENVLSKPSLIKLQEFTRQVPIADDIKHRAVEIVSETREHEDLNYGASPRASINLVLAGKGRALVEGRNYVSESDIDRMAKPVLRHRLGINFRAEKEGKDEDDVIEEIVDEV